MATLPAGSPSAQLRRLGRADVPPETEDFARFLIGRRIVRRFADDVVLSGRIVEVEAYAPSDPASHAYRGPTARNRAMFAQHMHAYVYFIYGTAYCLNISTEASGVGAAVLIRALEPVDGIAIMRARRGTAADRDLLRGPGRLCAALDIDRRFDGADLDTEPGLWLADDGAQPPPIGTSTRIGLTRAIDVRHRFFARGSAYVSGSRALSAGV